MEIVERGHNNLPKGLCEVVDFSAGNKLLKLRIYRRDRYAGTTVMNTENPRVPGATTVLYTAARARLQRIVNEECIPIDYSLSTSNEHMRLWALSTGRVLFNWDQVDMGMGASNLLVCEKRFEPRVLTATGS